MGFEIVREPNINNKGMVQPSSVNGVCPNVWCPNGILCGSLNAFCDGVDILCKSTRCNDVNCNTNFNCEFPLKSGCDVPVGVICNT
ncbi:hypothetical protein KQI38_13600 [Tissierella carlieri]|jgi:hypothetical protein|uniref:hypothetical protein n=1 Tax=Tissierella carlieri TaxID=689904 RepID=UPI001C10C653|nr:hypothetical protein [Tissierella carlieri]MBU5313073.1 hypothetical protein [Tissierella carlieri]